VLRLAAIVFGAGAIASVMLADHRGGGAAADSAASPTRPTGLFAPGIVRAATSMAVLRGVVGFLAFHIAFSFRREGIENVWLGVAIAASAGGSLLGSALAPKVRAVLREELIVLGALMGVAVTGLVAWQTAGVAMAAVLAFAVAVAAASAKLAFDSLVQRDNGDAVQGRAFARFEACFQLVWVVGALLAVLIPFSPAVGGLVVALATAGGAVAYAVELVSRRSAAASGRSRDGGAEPSSGGGHEPRPPTGQPPPVPAWPQAVATPRPAPPPPAPPTTELPIASTVEVQLPGAPGDRS
jgi:hypothetical protein